MNLDEYFDKLNTDDYIIFISAYDDASKQWGNFKHRAALGLKTQLNFRGSYIAVIDTSCKYVLEKSGYEFLKLTYILPDGVMVKLSSCGWHIQPSTSEIIIGETNYSRVKRGCNFALYNKQQHKITESFFVDFYADQNLNVNFAADEFNYKLESIKRGWQIADKYCQYDNSVFYYVLNRHIGDANRVLKGIRAVKDYYGVNASRLHFENIAQQKNIVQKFNKTKTVKKLYIVASFANSGVAKLYSEYIDGVIALDNASIKDLCAYAASSAAIHQNIICDEDMQRQVWDRWKTDEGQYARSLMFGVTYMEWDFAIPKGMPRAVPEVSQESMAAAQKIIFENNLVPEKTIILSPMAQSSTLLDNRIWEKYVKVLKDKQYSVFTNTGKNEKALEGTLSLFCPVDVVAALAKSGVKIVGIQSGLTDVIADVAPQFLTVLVLVKKGVGQDEQFARNRGVSQEGITISDKGITYIKTENFNEDNIINLLSKNIN